MISFIQHISIQHWKHIWPSSRWGWIELWKIFILFKAKNSFCKQKSFTESQWSRVYGTAKNKLASSTNEL